MFKWSFVFKIFGFFCALFVLYLLKCAVNINLFDHYSVGIWGYFKPYFKWLS